MRAKMRAAQNSITVPICHIGQQVSLLNFVAHYPGHDTHLYDGSFEDWKHRPDLLIVEVDTVKF